MAKKQFRTESKRILDLMVNSIYTNKEIFLRELISNASDAIDKLYFRSLTDQSVGMNRSDFAIDLAIDKDARTLTVSDNGIGMTAEELEKNLGTIAHSGSLDFTKNNELSEEIDIIGQFGVGFYSAFMVADRITVTSRAFGADSANRWESEGGDGYTVSPAEKETAGTEIVLHLKENTEHDKFDEFLDPWRVSSIVKRYSDYIRYPIRMDRRCGTTTTKRRRRTKTAIPRSSTKRPNLSILSTAWFRSGNAIRKMLPTRNTSPFIKRSSTITPSLFG